MAWKRQRRSNLPAPNANQGASIGDSHVEAALLDLRRTAQVAMTTRVSYGPCFNGTLEMLFDQDTLTRARNARGIIEPSSPTALYHVTPACWLGMHFDGSNTPTIMPEKLAVQPSAAPLLRMMEEARGIHDSFEEVKAVLQWMNRNATPGAVRYYWPTAMNLAKEAPIWKDLREVPSRYTIPRHIQDLLQSLKDTAATMAGALLLPDNVEPRPRAKMWLHFPRRSIKVTPDWSYETEQVVYNL